MKKSGTKSSTSSTIDDYNPWEILQQYFEDTPNYFARHAIDSYDRFIKNDIHETLRQRNPIISYNEYEVAHKRYKYTIKLYIGGRDGTAIYWTHPLVSVKIPEKNENIKDGDINTQPITLREVVRELTPNEARLRNLSYSSYMGVDIIVDYEIWTGPTTKETRTFTFEKVLLCQFPIMLKSVLCVLRDKPLELLQEYGECPYDHGGYFIINGAEKVLISQDRTAYNTPDTKIQSETERYSHYLNIKCRREGNVIPKTVALGIDKNSGQIEVTLPNVQNPIPLFIVFRALGVIADKDILECIFHDLEGDEAKLMLNDLIPSITGAHPVYDQSLALEIMRTFTKSTNMTQILDIIRNQFLINIPDNYYQKALYLGYLTRKILRLKHGLDAEINKDSFLNKRVALAGQLLNELFMEQLKTVISYMKVKLSKEYNLNQSTYKDLNYLNILTGENIDKFLVLEGDDTGRTSITRGIFRGFKGNWFVQNKVVDGVS
jgi:DNA-directed RNA polymerase II subunit RPB2